jgi:hypothetical protein
MTFSRDRLFAELDIETHGLCNRFCPTCLRNSTPDNLEVMPDRFGKKKLMPTKMVFDIIDDAAGMGFNGVINFSHFNEPLQDERLWRFGRHAMKTGKFSDVMFHTNADLLTERRAKLLNGNFTKATVALYDGLDTAENRARLQAMVPDIQLIWTGGNHIVTHFSPWSEALAHYISQAKDQPCQLNTQKRMIIDYKGDMLLCCEDIGIYPTLGNYHNTPSLYQLWYSDKHMEILETLDKAGGRSRYKFCMSCPRLNEVY